MMERMEDDEFRDKIVFSHEVGLFLSGKRVLSKFVIMDMEDDIPVEVDRNFSGTKNGNVENHKQNHHPASSAVISANFLVTVVQLQLATPCVRGGAQKEKVCEKYEALTKYRF
ncbi:hypothetical protein C0J52_26655 [Blattella germanica]|nr:hypothetical protein C0J52_26655 [Blattella germanica]